MRNRALEFLIEAERLLTWWGNSEKGQMLVRLAIGEVQELEARIAELEGRRPDVAQARPGVLIVDAQPMTPARLTESQSTATALEWRRAALPGNSHK